MLLDSTSTFASLVLANKSLSLCWLAEEMWRFSAWLSSLGGWFSATVDSARTLFVVMLVPRKHPSTNGLSSGEVELPII